MLVRGYSHLPPTPHHYTLAHTYTLPRTLRTFCLLFTHLRVWCGFTVTRFPFTFPVYLTTVLHVWLLPDSHDVPRYYRTHSPHFTHLVWLLPVRCLLFSYGLPHVHVYGSTSYVRLLPRLLRYVTFLTRYLHGRTCAHTVHYTTFCCTFRSGLLPFTFTFSLRSRYYALRSRLTLRSDPTLPYVPRTHRNYPIRPPLYRLWFDLRLPLYVVGILLHVAVTLLLMLRSTFNSPVSPIYYVFDLRFPLLRTFPTVTSLRCCYLRCCDVHLLFFTPFYLRSLR